jgi:hypothetical protein
LADYQKDLGILLQEEVAKLTGGPMPHVPTQPAQSETDLSKMVGPGSIHTEQVAISPALSGKFRFPPVNFSTVWSKIWSASVVLIVAVALLMVSLGFNAYLFRVHRYGPLSKIAYTFQSSDELYRPGVKGVFMADLEAHLLNATAVLNDVPFDLQKRDRYNQFSF